MEKVDYAENFDLTNIVTPINANILQVELEKSGYDSSETQYLVNGFKKGFDIGYDGPKV